MTHGHIYDMIIVGGGPGGYTAALYAARAGLDTLVLEKLSAGGQMALTQQIDNYPGFEDSVDGFTLAEKMQAQAERFGARTEYAQVERLDLTASPKVLETSEGTFLGKTVVLATGADPRKLGVDHEEALVGRGVAYCAACDGMFYRGKTVVVVGGGNSAAADALLLSRIAKKGHSGSPPGRSPGHEDLPRASEAGGKPGVPLEQRHHRPSIWRPADRRAAEELKQRRGFQFGLRRPVYQRGEDPRHRAGAGTAGAGSRRLYSGRRDH